MKNMNNFYRIIICLMLLLSFNKISVAQVSEQDSLALVALYDSTDGDNWTNHENWLTGPVATWYGVTVSGDRVVEVILEDNNLVGRIPTEISHLTELKVLSLYRNQLIGEIPPAVGMLTKLRRLSFYVNQLTGNIPPEIGELVNLTTLALGGNHLTGEIPVELGTLIKLTTLNLEENELSGEIPSEIGNMTKLIRLFLSNNQLSGEIPVEIYSLSNLDWLALGHNQLSGEISTDIGNLINLTYGLSLQRNQLTGEIPSTIGNLTNLTVLWIGNNQLTGEIPPEISNLTDLTKLDLSFNQLVGEIPIEIGNLTNLTELYLYENQLSGEIPTEILNLTKLEILYLENNKFISSPNFSSISTLNTLHIERNKFTFEDIEPNVGISTFVYSPQDSVGERLDTTISAGESLTLSVNVGGTANIYQWKKDGSVIPGATETNYTIDTADASDAGTYICEITNTIATELTLYSREMKVTVEGAVGIENTENEIPTEFKLYQNYPNPFNPTTTIKYQISRQAELPPLAKGRAGVGSHVTLKVYNILGKEITTLVNKKQPPGIYKVTFDASDLPSGVYIYKIRAGSFEQSKKLLFMK